MKNLEIENTLLEVFELLTKLAVGWTDENQGTFDSLGINSHLQSFDEMAYDFYNMYSEFNLANVREVV
jgi:hypothetical protein